MESLFYLPDVWETSAELLSEESKWEGGLCLEAGEKKKEGENKALDSLKSLKKLG